MVEKNHNQKLSTLNKHFLEVCKAYASGKLQKLNCWCGAEVIKHHFFNDEIERMLYVSKPARKSKKFKARLYTMGQKVKTSNGYEQTMVLLAVSYFDMPYKKLVEILEDI